MSFLCACAFSFQSFNFVENFDFISKIWFYLSKSCVSAPHKKAWKAHLIKNSAMHVFSMRLCVFIPIFQLCSKLWFHFINMILFSKIMFSCAAQKSMKNTLDKKIQECMSFPYTCKFSFQSFQSISTASSTRDFKMAKIDHSRISIV